ncbi:MAG: RagB/SusD family nutrient uptake outer membrane protein, partial [Leadbetterella sp.]|nr:RagB/SusD family nutrient uptake outer membrane protein [Leadbetterella sp.]
LDFILDERTRELCGESTRWPDLAVRGKLIDRVKLFNADAAATITAGKHELRPIPQSQLDRVAEAETHKYQNPNY